MLSKMQAIRVHSRTKLSRSLTTALITVLNAEEDRGVTKKAVAAMGMASDFRRLEAMSLIRLQPEKVGDELYWKVYRLTPPGKVMVMRVLAAIHNSDKVEPYPDDAPVHDEVPDGEAN